MSQNRYPSLGDRMKEYEAIPQNKLTRRMPVIIRLDGKGFHNYTRKMQKPYDFNLQLNIWRSTTRLCQEIQNTVLAYCQSDEVSLLLIDYNTLNTQPWFANEVQKLCSLAASSMTSYFNDPETRGDLPYGARFDARCFNLPREEVTNYYYWRQNDWQRNSIQMLAQYYFSPKQLYKKNTCQMKEMVLKETGINWDIDLQPFQRRGTACIKKEGKWITDCNLPLFNEDKSYIENLLYNDSNILTSPKTFL